MAEAERVSEYKTLMARSQHLESGELEGRLLDHADDDTRDRGVAGKNEDP
jgi:hypothetical protein